jgi:amidase
MNWNFESAEEIVAALRAGHVTSVELTDEAIAHIERDDKVINAICVPDFDRARAAARAADATRARGEDRPLLGVPVTVKESYNIAGLPTTWGMPQYRDYLPAEDAVQVSRLRAAGAVVLGKTNVPLGLQDLQSFNEIYGTTNNPWDHARTAGGSSGGSAAALASGFGALSIGSDIGGSLRTPAHFCGVYAHKPTLGLVAPRGMVAPPAPALPVDLDLAVVGPMARTARDLTLLLDVMAGPDPLTYGVAHHLTLPPTRHQQLSDFRVLVLDEHPLLPTGTAVRTGVNRVADALADGGAHVVRHTPLLPDLAEAARLYTQLLFSGSVARFPIEAYEQLQTRAAVLTADDQSLDAERLRGMVLTHRDWLEAKQPPRGTPPRLATILHRVRRRGVPDHPDSRIPPRPQPRPTGTPNRHRRRRAPVLRPARLGRPSHHARPTVHRRSDRPVPRRPAGRSATDRPNVRGPYATPAGRTTRRNHRRLPAGAS